MDVAFLSENPPNSMASFSGIPYFMAQSLRSAAGNLSYVRTAPIDLTRMFAAPTAGRRQLEEIGKAATHALREVRADVVVCQGSSMIPFLETDRPILLWHDSTWLSVLRMPFDEFVYCHPLLYEWDRRVIEKCDFVVFAADWVRDETLAYYQVDPEKIVVVPFGANIPDSRNGDREHSIDERLSLPCELTFIGVDWARKGLPLAHSLLNRLNLAGLPTVLNVIGCSLDGQLTDRTPLIDECGVHAFVSEELTRLRIRSDKNVRVRGFLPKDRPDTYREFAETLARTSFLVHPASFECFGVALADANAFGVPVLAVDAFGPKTIVRPGVNGHLFSADDFVGKATAVVYRSFYEHETYAAEASGAVAEYRRRLNWPTSCQRVLELLARGGTYS